MQHDVIFLWDWREHDETWTMVTCVFHMDQMVSKIMSFGMLQMLWRFSHPLQQTDAHFLIQILQIKMMPLVNYSFSTLTKKLAPKQHIIGNHIRKYGLIIWKRWNIDSISMTYAKFTCGFKSINSPPNSLKNPNVGSRMKQ